MQPGSKHKNKIELLNERSKIAEEGGVLIPMFASIVAATRKGCTGYTPASDHNRPDFTQIVCE